MLLQQPVRFLSLSKNIFSWRLKGRKNGMHIIRYRGNKGGPNNQAAPLAKLSIMSVRSPSESELAVSSSSSKPAVQRSRCETYYVYIPCHVASATKEPLEDSSGLWPGMKPVTWIQNDIYIYNIFISTRAQWKSTAWYRSFSQMLACWTIKFAGSLP